jgi:intein/homing endonuclease
VQVLGHVSSGKTTLLGALLASIDPNAKIITLEDTMELRLPHENWQRFHTRPVHFASSERFEVKLFDLLRLVMRHRPDYVVVGETRGEEMRNLTHSASLGHSCACLPGDEMILYTQGERYELSPIGDFVENILRGKILNPRVFSFDPSGRVVESALKRVYKVPSSCTIEEIKIEGGKLFRASPNHPVLVLDRGKIVQKRADEVAKGDLIPVLLKLPKKETQSKIDIIELLKDTNIYIRLGPKAKNVAASKKSLLLNSGYSIYNVYDWVERGSAMPLEAYLLIEENERSIRENVEVQWGRKGKGRIPGIIPLNENFGKVLGYYLADGFCSSVVNFAFGKKKTQHSRDLIEALKKLKIPYSVLPSKAPGVTAGSKVLALVLERLVGTGSHEKRIPGFVFNAPEEFQKALIKAYWKTDGRIRIRGKNSLMCVATTVSRELAYGLQYLLKIFGVDTSLRLDENSVGFGRPKPIKFYKSYEIQVLGGNSLKKFAEIMNRNVKTSLSFAERGSILPGDDFYFGKVKDRREVPFDGEWLYDVETEHGNFLHSGTVFTHNSTFHAESPEAALARMRADPINLKDDDILRVWCFATAAQVRRPSGELVYRVMSIHEINPTEEGRPELSEVFRYDIRSDSFSPDSPREVVRRSRRLRESAEARGMGERELADELRRKVGFLEQLVKRRELGYEQYIQRIREFYATRGG